MVFKCLIFTASCPALLQHACAGWTDAIVITATSAAFFTIPLILSPLFVFNKGMIDDPAYRILNRQGKAKVTIYPAVKVSR
jgi:hypothetical protein